MFFLIDEDEATVLDAMLKFRTVSIHAWMYIYIQTVTVNTLFKCISGDSFALYI